MLDFNRQTVSLIKNCCAKHSDVPPLVGFYLLFELIQYPKMFALPFRSRAVALVAERQCHRVLVVIRLVLMARTEAAARGICATQQEARPGIC